MMIPKYGVLHELSLHGKFAFNSFEEICWEHKKQVEAGVILYLPLNEGFKGLEQNYLMPYRKIYCDLEFLKEKKKIQVEGDILKHSGLTLQIEENGVVHSMFVVELYQNESVRFLRFLTEGHTKMMERMSRVREDETAVRPKRRDPRIPKKFKIEYSLTIPKMNFEKNEQYYPMMETIALQGETTDISKTGIFIKSEFLPPVNSVVKIRVFTDKGKIIESMGRVVRRVDNVPNSGFALEMISDYGIVKER